MFISIVENAYIVTLMESKQHWIYKYFDPSNLNVSYDKNKVPAKEQNRLQSGKYLQKVIEKSKMNKFEKKENNFSLENNQEPQMTFIESESQVKEFSVNLQKIMRPSYDSVKEKKFLK